MLTTVKMPPGQIDIPSAWRGEEMAANPGRWVVQLSAGEIAELEQAAKVIPRDDKGNRRDHERKISAAGFRRSPGPLKETLINGIGFEVIRGLPVAKYSQQFAATIFCGVGAHLGSARSQNAMGHILGHVRDVGADAKDPNTRIYQTAERQTFHTDSSDVVGLLCIREAMEGGKSLLVSTAAIYNEMLAPASRPRRSAV